MGTHEYLNIHGYPYSGYPRGYGAGTDIIFIPRDGDGYHDIRTYDLHPSVRVITETVRNKTNIHSTLPNDDHRCI